MDLLQHFAKEQTKAIDRPRLRTGDLVRVEMKIKEAGKERLQTFEGVVLGVRGSGPSVTFTVRREVGRFAVERIFPLYSPLITNIEITKRQKVRRAKLGYLRAAGRRRVKEDEIAMQRHVKEEADKKRLAEDAKRRAEEAKAKEEADKKKEEILRQAPTSAKATADKQDEKTPDVETASTEKSDDLGASETDTPGGDGSPTEEKE